MEMVQICSITEYRDVKEYYYIMTNGEVISMKTGKEYNLKKILHKDNGYYYICLSKILGKKSNIRINRLVALAFIPNQYNKPIVNHIDENKLNNNVYNLEWATQSENTRKSISKKKILSNQITTKAYDNSIRFGEAIALMEKKKIQQLEQINIFDFESI